MKKEKWIGVEGSSVSEAKLAKTGLLGHKEKLQKRKWLKCYFVFRKTIQVSM